jgi:hypothetical protein
MPSGRSTGSFAHTPAATGLMSRDTARTRPVPGPPTGGARAAVGAVSAPALSSHPTAVAQLPRSATGSLADESSKPSELDERAPQE